MRVLNKLHSTIVLEHEETALLLPIGTARPAELTHWDCVSSELTKYSKLGNRTSGP